MSAISDVVAASGPDLAAHAVADPPPGRFGGLLEDPNREFVLEAVYEGYLMHYGEPRAFARMDEDFRLLAGDALYALGLSRLAERGDLTAVAELADLISLCALVHSDGRPEMGEEIWRASSKALSAGGGPGARATFGDRLPSVY